MVDLHGEAVSSFMRVSNPARLAGLEGRKKEKKPGAGTKTCSVKTGLRGQKKRPLPRQKARDAARPRVPVTLWLTKTAVKIPQKEGANPPP